MSVRVRQVAFLLVGVVTAVVMATLGVWQAQRSLESGARGIQQRAEAAPAPLLDHINADGTVGDIYGKPVIITGRYLPHEQVLVPNSTGGLRVLTAFQVADGRVVPVVRGRVDPGAPIAAAPTGDRSESGLFLPGEGDPDGPVVEGQLGSVRMPLLAQRWDERLTPGFVTLDAAHAQAQGFQQASVVLPQGEQSVMNGSYALQWWIFAAFALGMGIKLARDVGERERRRLEADAVAARATVESSVPGDRAAGEDEQA